MERFKFLEILFALGFTLVSFLPSQTSNPVCAFSFLLCICWQVMRSAEAYGHITKAIKIPQWFITSHNQHTNIPWLHSCPEVYIWKWKDETRQTDCAASSRLPVQTALRETCGFEVQLCDSEFEWDDIRRMSICRKHPMAAHSANPALT